MELLFWVTAVFGTLFFLLKTIVSSFGIGVNVDDIDFDGDVPQSILPHKIPGTSSDYAFKLLSIQSLTGFFMMYGWVGLGCLYQYQMGPIAAQSFALIAGLIAMIITAAIFKGAKLLISHGDVFSIDQLIGKKGTVYTKISPDGTGKIVVIDNDRRREVIACSEERVEIMSFSDVEVIKKINKNLVSVRELKK